MTSPHFASAPARKTSRSVEWLLALSLCLWGVGVQISDGIASVGMGLTAVGVLLSARGRWPRPAEVLRAWLPLWIFIAWVLASSLLAGWFPTGTSIARLLDWVGIPLAACAWASVPEHRRRQFVCAASAFFVVSCAAATLQHFGWWPALEAFHALRWTHLPFYRMYEAVPGDAHRFMAGGLLFHRLKFAHVGGMVVIACGLIGLCRPGPARLPSLAVAATGFVIIFLFTYARAASVALVASLFVGLLWVRGARRGVLAAGGGLAVSALILALLIPSLRSRFLSASTSEGSGERRAFLETAFRAIEAHPFIGVGWGHFRPSLYATASTPTNVLAHPGKSHNQFVSIAAETGIPGALMFAGLLFWLGLRMRGGWLEGVFGRTCLLFFLLMCLLHDPIFHSEVSMALALVFGIGIARPDPRSET